MRTILLRTTMAGPTGVRQPGVHAVDDATADSLIAGGFATSNETVDSLESASVATPETAALPRPSRKRG